MYYANPSTVGRGKRFEITNKQKNGDHFFKNGINLHFGDSLDFYQDWSTPTVIISDGAYGILGFNGDTSNHLSIAEWYEPHILEWTKKATRRTTLWFWNTEIGWACVHPILEKLGWKYVNANIWNKGKAHIAGNVNTSKIKRFPVVTEVCVQYVFEPLIDGKNLQEWLHQEWKRTGLSLKSANIACGVANVASRKYLDKGHLWYCPPDEMFEKLSNYANLHGNIEGKPYFSFNGVSPLSRQEWEMMKPIFNCPIGFTNVWNRNPLKGKERIKVPNSQTASAHLNQKPLDLMMLIIEASSYENDVIWEPFGGLFSGSLAAMNLKRRSFAAEIDKDYFLIGVERFNT
ncbi:DNA methylase [Haemophilus sp. C1]|uniref:DNA methyltransferase n=1 Tax=Haemophilus sp. C1 TaxID=1661745 RepID=UPI0006AB8128|nr:DNA methyltransferase [Haemophilus sp. C1]KOQ97201.1 DNA methylase [Haemophilus sp. C1]